VDSFIWKVRSRSVRTTLAIQQGSNEEPVAQLREPVARGFAHALAYFGIPLALISLLGASNRAIPASRELRSLAREADVFPRSAFAHAEYGRGALLARDPVTARRELTAAIGLAPSLAGPALMLVDLDRAEGNPEAELEHARLAVEADRDDPVVRYALGNALAQHRLLDEAEVQYRKAIALRPSFAGAEENLGVLYKWRSRLDLAIPHFRRAHALDPDLSAAACDLAGALATLGRTEEALSILHDYRTRHPEDRVAADLEEAIHNASRR
jgi:tetratricopeptide (TPR) repeat protein